MATQQSFLKTFRGRVITRMKEDQETRAWKRGYTWAKKNGYTSIRDCRIIAMAYSKGFLNGRRNVVLFLPKKEIVKMIDSRA